MTEITAPAKRLHLITFLAALLACVAVVLWMVGPYLLSLFLGGTLAMLAVPPYQWLLAKKWRPQPAASAVTVMFLLLVVAPLGGFAVLAVRQGIAMGQQMGELKEFSPKAMSAAISHSDLVETMIGDPAVVNTWIKSAIQSAGQFTSAAVLRLGAGAPLFFLQVLLTLVAFYFFLLDGGRFMEWLLGLGILDRNVQKQLVDAFRDTAISAVLAGLAAASAQAAMIAAAFLLLDVPGAFLAGSLTFIFAWIPLLGTAPASLAGLLYLYSQGSSAKMIVMIALAISAGIVDNLVRALVLKGRADMHPLLGLVAVIGGIQMFGILGVFIGPIVAAMLLALLRIWPVLAGRFQIIPTSDR